MGDELFKPYGLLLCQYILRTLISVANLVWHSCQRQIHLLVKLVNNNYLRTKSLFFSFQQIPALSEQCSPVAIVIADTAPYFRLVFWLLLPWDLHLSLPHSTCCSSPTLPHCLCTLSVVERFLHLIMLSCISVKLLPKSVTVFPVLVNWTNDDDDSSVYILSICSRISMSAN